MRKLSFLFSVSLISACTLYQDPTVPMLGIPDEFKETINVDNKGLKNQWWENFNDCQLNELIMLGLNTNNNYQISLKNIDIAQTYVSQNLSYLFPQINATFSSSRNKVVPAEFGNFSVMASSPSSSTTTGTSALSSKSRIFDLQVLTFSATYEIDVWNQIRNSVKQSKANVDVSVAESNVIKLTLVSNIATAYFQIMALSQNINNLNQQLKMANEITTLSKVQLKSGLINESSVYAAINQQEAILMMVKNSEKQKQIYEYILAYLLGLYPENFSIETSNKLAHLHFTKLIPAGLPSEMVAMRPDIQAAYFQILSYGYLQKQTIANFLPSFTLTGNYGYAATALPQLLKSSNAFWNYGLGMSQYIFDYAIRMSEYKRASYQFESAILGFKDTVTNAFAEVNTALVSYKEDHESLLALQKQGLNYKEIAGISKAQYNAGLVDYSVYLTNALALLQNEFTIVNQQLLVTQDIILVYKTLGLGL